MRVVLCQPALAMPPVKLQGADTNQRLLSILSRLTANISGDLSVIAFTIFFGTKNVQRPIWHRKLSNNNQMAEGNMWSRENHSCLW